MKEFTVLIEKDEDGVFIGRVPSLAGCHSYGHTMDELLENMREAIALCYDVEKDKSANQFVGVQMLEVAL